MAVVTPTLPFFSSEPLGLFSQIPPLTSSTSSLMISNVDNGGSGAAAASSQHLLGSSLTMAGPSLFTGYGDSSSFSQWDSYTNFFSLPNPGSIIPNSSSLSEPLVFSSEVDILNDSEFLQQINGCSSNSTPVMHPNLVSTLKNMVAPGPGSPGSQGGFDSQSCFEQNQRETLKNTFFGQIEDETKALVAVQECQPPQPVPLDCRAPGVLLKVEKSETEELEDQQDEEDNIDVVPVALIQNRRPFRCHHEGCNKTFKNPQTMKMHHKTHYTDGSIASRAGLMTLPTLSSSLKAGHNKKIPSRCPKCKKTFVGLYELRRHYGRKHSEGEKPFGCRKCGKKFYIEVDVRDHEKLCGEPIGCKCGLKFAFKCNLVAHKKAHPACQDQTGSTTNTMANSTTTTTTTTTSHHQSSHQSSSSSDSSEESRDSSSVSTAGRGTKRAREEIFSSLQSNVHTMITVPDFKGLPEVTEFKMARHEYLASPGFSSSTTTTENSVSGQNNYINNMMSSLAASGMHYPLVTFSDFPGNHMSSSLYPNLAADQGHRYLSKLPFYEAVHGEMGTISPYNHLSLKTWSS